jgi:hypothetical protein
VFRRILLLLACLVPLITLVHQNDLRYWEANRAAMVAPDEFSYLLTAEAILHGQGISTQKTLGIDTFYPPGYPLLLAIWGAALGGLTAFKAHVLNALLVCAATGVVYLFSKRLLALVAESEHRRMRWSAATSGWIALLIAGIFATNWHVLESALYVFSEPAFMLATFAWLALGLKWREWFVSYRKTLAVTLLAIAAWSIRGAGLVCVVVTVVYPLVILLRSRARLRARVGPIVLIVALAIAYQLIIMWASPSKSLASTDAASHGYPAQLLNGITDRGHLRLGNVRDWPELAWHVADLGMSHVDDFAASFVPWYRDPPDMMVRIFIGKLLAAMALLGFVAHLLRRNAATWFLDAYIVCYFGLYLLWPFNMARFWIPILPVMLVYLVDGVRAFGAVRRIFLPQRVAGVLLALVLILASVELWVQLGNYERRVNYVTDCLAVAAASVVKASPDAAKTTVIVAGQDEHLLFAWYLPKDRVPVSPKGEERAQQLILRAVAQMRRDPARRVFVIDYFRQVGYPKLWKWMQAKWAAELQGFELRHVYEAGGNVAAVWEIVEKNKSIKE